MNNEDEDQIRQRATLTSKQFAEITPPLRDEDLKLFEGQFITPLLAMYFLRNVREIWSKKSEQSPQSLSALSEAMESEVMHLGTINRIGTLLKMLEDGCFVFDYDAKQPWPVEDVKNLVARIVGPLSHNSILGSDQLDHELKLLKMGDYNSF
jgi:hypothetical protein